MKTKISKQLRRVIEIADAVEPGILAADLDNQINDAVSALEEIADHLEEAGL